MKTSSLFIFADDTTTDNKDNIKSEIKDRLQVDANHVLDFMASNGLAANQSKTEFMVLNDKDRSDTTLDELLVGNTVIQRAASTKLLGIFFEDSQEWQLQLKTVTSALNQRLFVIRHIQNQLPQEKLLCVVHSLWGCKLRFGLQLCTNVILNSDGKRIASLKSLQLTQNQMLRCINHSRVSDKISIKSMLTNFGFLSVNQLVAQIKLVEVWKSIHVPSYPLSLEAYNPQRAESSHNIRVRPNRTFNDSTRLQVSQNSFCIDAARVWNQAPHTAQSLCIAKKEILKF